jgi:hypothetical protein
LSTRQERTKIEGYVSTREGDKGAKSFYYILFTHLGNSWENWLHELPGEAMWCFIACNYINPDFWVVWGFLIFVVGRSLLLDPHSFFLILGIGLGMGNKLWEEKSHFLLVISNYWLFQKGMDA